MKFEINNDGSNNNNNAWMTMREVDGEERVRIPV